MPQAFFTFFREYPLYPSLTQLLNRYQYNLRKIVISQKIFLCVLEYGNSRKYSYIKTSSFTPYINNFYSSIFILYLKKMGTKRKLKRTDKRQYYDYPLLMQNNRHQLQTPSSCFSRWQFQPGSRELTMPENSTRHTCSYLFGDQCKLVVVYRCISHS